MRTNTPAPENRKLAGQMDLIWSYQTAAPHTGTFITASHQHSGKLMNNAFPSDFLPYLLAWGNIDLKKKKST